jgi:hypothetical protein
MYLPVQSQHSCALAWLAATNAVDAQAGHEAHNVVIDIEDPVVDITRAHSVVAEVDDFLKIREKSVFTVANTIFPHGMYQLHGAPAFFDIFQQKVLPKVRKNQRWSGYYFERMIDHPSRSGERMNLLWDIVERIRNFDERPSYNKYELPLFDPERDVDRSPYGGQCLSFLSFKLFRGEERRLALTALYRNHFYIEKLLGNLIGLGRLMAFVAREAGVAVGPLTVISTHAQIDTVNSSRAEVRGLIDRCSSSSNVRSAA